MKIAKVKKMVNEKERQQKILCLERKRDDRLQEEMSKNFWPQFLPNPGGYNFLEVTDTSKKRCVTYKIKNIDFNIEKNVNDFSYSTGLDFQSHIDLFTEFLIIQDEIEPVDVFTQSIKGKSTVDTQTEPNKETK